MMFKNKSVKTQSSLTYHNFDLILARRIELGLGNNLKDPSTIPISCLHQDISIKLRGLLIKFCPVVL